MSEQTNKQTIMDHESDGADECQPTASNTNVRIKVSSWVTNFVSEMRTKSPAVVQRWVDSLPNENVTELPGDTLIEADNNHHQDTAASADDVGIFSGPYCESTIPNTIVAEPNIVDITNQVDELNVDTEKDIPCKVSDNETQTLGLLECDSIGSSGTETTDSDRRFWKKGASVLTALRIRSGTDTNRNTETEDLNASPLLSQSDEPDKSTPDNPLLNKTKLNEFYYKLSISKKRYNFIKDRKMEAKKLLNNAKSRFLAATKWDETQTMDDESDNPENRVAANEEHGDNSQTANASAAETLAPTTTAPVKSAPEASGASASAVCDTIDMDLSADEFSRLSHSNDMLSADDEDSFNVSMPSIDSHTTHLNVSRRIAMADIGRSTSDNPRLRNKFYLADIGRSFSEHQDDEAIIIGERNISAPSSSIAIQNNNRSNGNFFERRAYSVSPTQRGLKRGVLSRDHSLSDSSRHRNQLSKGSSFQSDSSHCSSVESLLDARKPDSEAILRQLGFGPAHQEDLLSRIPKRFLKPSQVPGIDTEAFMRQQQIASNLHEQSILGYRGLSGNPHVLPSVIVAKIMDRFQLSDDKSKMYDVFNDGRPMSAPPTPGPTDLGDMRLPEPFYGTEPKPT